MRIEDVENTMDMKLEITRSDEKFKGILTFFQYLGIIFIAFIGDALQKEFGFGDQIILWLIFASIFVLGVMSIGSQITTANLCNDILESLYHSHQLAVKSFEKPPLKNFRPEWA